MNKRRRFKAKSRRASRTRGAVISILLDQAFYAFMAWEPEPDSPTDDDMVKR